MKAAIAAAILAGCAMASPAFAEHHDRPGADWIRPEQVSEVLRNAGYGPVTSLEADDGHWEGKTTRNGQRFEFHVDPHTGAITKAQPER